MTESGLNKLIEPEDEADTCVLCGNTYRIDLLKESDNWNDFGYRYCPFCGDMTDQYA